MKVINYNEIDEISGLCGKIKESFRDDIGFARSEMEEGLSTAHFHRKTVEYYLVIEGRGVLRIQDEDGKKAETELGPDVLVKIDKNEIHQTNNLGGLVLEAITTPVWTKEDEIESDLNLFE